MIILFFILFFLINSYFFYIYLFQKKSGYHISVHGRQKSPPPSNWWCGDWIKLETSQPGVFGDFKDAFADCFVWGLHFEPGDKTNIGIGSADMHMIISDRPLAPDAEVKFERTRERGHVGIVIGSSSQNYFRQIHFYKKLTDRAVIGALYEAYRNQNRLEIGFLFSRVQFEVQKFNTDDRTQFNGWDDRVTCPTAVQICVVGINDNQ